MVDNTADELMGSEIEAQEFLALRRKYMRVFASDDGIKVLEDLRARCFMDMSTFDPDLHYAKENILFNEGMRVTYLHIQTMISGEDMETEEE